MGGISVLRIPGSTLFSVLEGLAYCLISAIGLGFEGENTRRGASAAVSSRQRGRQASFLLCQALVVLYERLC